MQSSMRARFGALLSVCALATAAFATSASAEVVDDKPGAVAAGLGQVTVAARGTGGDVLARSWVQSANMWTPWVSLGGAASSGPAVSQRADGTTDFFIRGTDNQIWHKYTSGSYTSGWGQLGGALASAPAASVRKGTGDIDLFAKGSDGAVWFKTWAASRGWSDWVTLGGYTKSAPAAVSTTAGGIDVFIRGGDDQIYVRSFRGTSWSDWAPIGGGASGAPSAASQSDGKVDVFYTGYDGRVYQRSWLGSSWSSWVNLDTIATSAPAAVAEGSGRVNLFVRGGDLLYINQYAGGGWTNWQNFGPAAEPVLDLDPESASAASPSPPTARSAADTGCRSLDLANDIIVANNFGRSTARLGKVTHSTNFCWNKDTHVATFGNRNYATLNLRAGVSLLGWQVNEDTSRRTSFNVSWGGYAKGQIGMSTGVRARYCMIKWFEICGNWRNVTPLTYGHFDGSYADRYHTGG